ncbi:ChaN family lipoprotein [Roseovarius pacificus]|uniref:ChaN family lipoprotein n=1 Tax=Roseovarius pacificus TaxID=337701 RepID=UPI00403A3283
MKLFHTAIFTIGVASSAALAQDVVVVGEVHDNPAHHRVQAEIVREVAPKALVFEMLTSGQADAITPDNRGDPVALAKALDWANSGWPDFSMYYPIIAAAPEARIYGAQVPRDVARAAFGDGIAASFSGDAETYGLTAPLPEAQKSAREAMQMVAHCDALPQETLPGMVAIQRLRDAELAHAVVQAMQDTGGPVVLITGNGHARKDWGAPFYLERVAPDLELRVIGQSEDDAPLAGEYDEIRSAPAVEREDPCAAFKGSG